MYDYRVSYLEIGVKKKWHHSRANALENAFAYIQSSVEVFPLSASDYTTSN